jgi:indole-3-glycerol phosphate synthase
VADATPDFLVEMRAHSRARARALASQAAALEAEAERRPTPVPLALGDFGIIAELKLRAPSAGALARDTDETAIAARVRRYAEGGACAVSVLTEPSRFDGSLAHLAGASAALGPRAPTMRKDFLVDPLQVVEARCAGASGVLLVARMLDDSELEACAACARGLGMFVLLEAFDRPDLERAARLTGPDVLLGVNCRDLTTLAIDVARFEALAPHLPSGRAVIAESGLSTPSDVRGVAALGYRGALVGSALMRVADPRGAIAAMHEAVRGEERPCA